MSTDSDLYGDDIRLWSERQGTLLRMLAAGDAVTNQVDWPHVIQEIEDLRHTDPQQQEIARLTALLSAAEERVSELRARLNDLTGKLAETQSALASAKAQTDAATARADAVEAEEGIGQAHPVGPRGKGCWTRLRAAWRGE